MKSDEELFGALEEAATGLVYMSESDYPVEVVKWSGLEQLSPEYVRRMAGADAEAKFEESDIERFFRVPAGEQEWKGEEQLAEARKYQRLRHVLEANLAGIRVYRVGEINIGVYVVGRSGNGDWLPGRTPLVET